MTGSAEDSIESPERRQLRASVRDSLAAAMPVEDALAHDRSGAFPERAWAALAEVGALGLGVPEDLGGSGGSVLDAIVVTEEIARRLPSLAVDYVAAGMAARLLMDVGTADQRAWLRPLVEGTAVYAFGMSEASGGTDLLALRTRAELQDDVWVVTGAKQWTSLATEADLVFTLTRTDGDASQGARGLSLIAVPTDQAAVVRHRMPLEVMRAARTSEVFFDGARAPSDHLVGRRGDGFRALGGMLDVERLLAASISVGIAVAAQDLAVAYAAERTAFGGSIGRFQAIAHPLADSAAEIEAAIALLERAAQASAAGAAGTLTGMAKLVASETAARVVDRTTRVLAASAFSADSPAQMLFRDARLQLVSPITNEMVRNQLAESLGLPRSYRA